MQNTIKIKTENEKDIRFWLLQQAGSQEEHKYEKKLRLKS